MIHTQHDGIETTALGAKGPGDNSSQKDVKNNCDVDFLQMGQLLGHFHAR